MDKICTKCKESKPATTEYFFSDKVLKSGLRAKCKTCMTKLNKEYLKTHSEKIKQQNRERYHANKEQYSQQKKEYRIAHKEEISQQKKEYYHAHKEKINQHNKEHYNANKEKINKQKMEYYHAHKEEASQRNKEYRQTPGGIYRNLSGRNPHLKKCSVKQFEDWYNNEPKVCKYCDLPEEYVKVILQLFRKTSKLSIDRLNPNGFYELGNMALCCLRCNFVKSKIFTPQEMREIAQKYIKPKWQAKIK